jgi:pimeloyl-ACP methyl ester carboxylesterase
LFGKSKAEEKIIVPTLFVYGEKDHAVLPQTVEGVSEFVDAEYTELRIPESGHWVQLEAREKVTEALVEFLAE